MIKKSALLGCRAINLLDLMTELFHDNPVIPQLSAQVLVR